MPTKCTTALSDSMTEDIENLAEEYDTNRATIMRMLIHFGLQVEEMRDDLTPAEAARYESRNAIDMTLDGQHPRWDKPKRR